MNNIKTKILDAAQKNTLTMVPKWKFVLYSLLWFIGLVFTFLLVVFVVSLILFVLSRYGFIYMPFFGAAHIFQTIGAVPPLLFLVAVLLIVLIEIISRHYAFSFKRPLLVTVFFVTLLAVVAGFVISETAMHEHVRKYAKNNRITMMEQMYDRPVPIMRRGGMDVIRGEVLVSSPTSTVLKLFNEQEIVAYVSATDTMYIPPEVGSDVVIIGTLMDDYFRIARVRDAKSMHFGNHKEGKRMMMNYNNPDFKKEFPRQEPIMK